MKMKKILSLTLIFTAAVGVFADAPSVTLGWRLLGQGKYVESEKEFRAVAQTGNFVGVTGTMFALRRQKRNADVIKEVDAWIAANPNATADQKAGLLNFKGNALRDTGKYEEAFAVYNEGMNLKSPGPSSTDCAKEAIGTAVNTNKLDLAKKIYEEALKQPVAMKNVGFIINAANLMWKVNNPEEGMKLLDAVEKLKYPAYLEECIHRTRGYFYRDGFGKQEEAVKCFEKALAVPNISAVQKAVLWNNIGMAYEKDEEYEKAVEAYKKVGTFGASGWFIKSAEGSAARLQKKIDAGE